MSTLRTTPQPGGHPMDGGCLYSFPSLSTGGQTRFGVAWVFLSANVLTAPGAPEIIGRRSTFQEKQRRGQFQSDVRVVDSRGRDPRRHAGAPSDAAHRGREGGAG